MAAHHYKAKAAHLSVMAGLAWRGYNVAMPEIDIGDDIFAVKDHSGNMWRIQVKYSQAKAQKNGISATFGCRKDQLEKATSPELYYVFVFRKGEGWQYAIFSRASLQTHFQHNGFGAVFHNKAAHQDFVNFRVALANDGKLTFGSGKDKKDITLNLNKWNEIPST